MSNQKRPTTGKWYYDGMQFIYKMGIYCLFKMFRNVSF